MEERLYDLIFIARPATPEEEIKKILSLIEHTCAEKGGKIEKTEHWGTRKLAYQAPRRHLRLPADSHHARRADLRTGAPLARAGHGDQIPDRTPG
jgi:ribosomal protein S6